MKRLRKALWRYWRRLEIGRAFRERRRQAGLCIQCKGKRLPHTLRCEECSRYNSDQAAVYRKLGAAKDWPRFWQEHPELVERNDQVLQAAWEKEHA